MPKLNQKGIAQVIILLILVAGLGAGLYLSQKNTIFKPKAFEYFPSQCSNRVAQFSVSGPCNSVGNGFQNVSFSCTNESITPIPPLPASLADQGACNTVGRWFSLAMRECRKSCLVSPQPSTSPHPPFPTPSSTPEPRVCAAVITPARNLKTGECKDFPTPCDVPDGWQKVESCSSQGTPSPSCAPGSIECPAPPANCRWEGGTSCSCGKLVCSQLF